MCQRRLCLWESTPRRFLSRTLWVTSLNSFIYEFIDDVLTFRIEERENGSIVWASDPKANVLNPPSRENFYYRERSCRLFVLLQPSREAEPWILIQNNMPELQIFERQNSRQFILSKANGGRYDVLDLSFNSVLGKSCCSSKQRPSVASLLIAVQDQSSDVPSFAQNWL